MGSSLPRPKQVYEYKSRISFSEISDWASCSYKHKLKYLDKVEMEDNNPYFAFGSAVHDACEEYVKTRTMDTEKPKIAFAKAWQDQKLYATLDWKGNPIDPLEEWMTSIDNILGAVPSFLDETFPNWELVDAEELIQEPVEDMDHLEMIFKGKVDLIIKSKNKYWILDWKTSVAGWKAYKKTSFNTKAQIYLYKHYWSKKHNIPLKDINTGFIILKRYVKMEDDSHCELFKVAAKESHINESIDLTKAVINSAYKGIYVKNTRACKFCPFNKTKYCKGEDYKNSMEANLL